MYCLQICDLQNVSFQNNRYYHDSFRVKTLNEHSDAFTSLRTTWMVPSHFYYFYHFEKRRKLLSIACWLGYWHTSHKLVFKMAHYNCLNSCIVQSTLTMPSFLISSEANCALFTFVTQILLPRIVTTFCVRTLNGRNDASSSFSHH